MDVAHLVERHLAKVEVAGSSPVIRSKEKEYQRCSFLLYKQAIGLRGSKASVKKTVRGTVFSEGADENIKRNTPYHAR